MKKILIMVTLFTGIMFPQIALDLKDALVTMADTDLMLWQEDTGAFENRKQSWLQLKTNISADMVGSARTWAGLQIYNAGSTFNLGSTGVVTFKDSVVYEHTMYPETMIPRVHDAYGMGIGAKRWLWATISDLYVTNIHVLNSSGSDSTDAVTMTYDGNTVDFGAVKLTADTISGLTTTSWYENTHSVSDVNDSSLTVNYGNNVTFLMPGASMTNLEAITMSNIPAGSIVHQVTFWIIDSQDYNIKFIDTDTAGGHTSDRNMQLAGDFDMDAGDSITLEWRPSQSATSGGDWQEVSRSDNR